MLRTPRSRWILVGVLALLTAGAVVLGLASSGEASPSGTNGVSVSAVPAVTTDKPSVAELYAGLNNEDPKATTCDGDAVTVGKPVSLKLANGTTVGSVVRRVSARCHAAWPKLINVRKPNVMVRLTAANAAGGRSDFTSPTSAGASPANDLFGNLVTTITGRNGRNTCVTVRATAFTPTSVGPVAKVAC